MIIEFPPHSIHLSHEQLCDLLFDSPIARNPVARDGADPASGPAQTGSLVHDAVRDHLTACPSCAAEYFALESGLSDFSNAMTGYAAEQFSQLKSAASQPAAGQRVAVLRARPTLYTRPLNWAIAAAILVAAILPVAAHHRLSPAHHGVTAIAAGHAQVLAADSSNSAASSNSEQDEALLEEIDNDTSSSVPTAMQALADPISTQTSVIDSISNNSNARKKNSNE